MFLKSEIFSRFSKLAETFQKDAPGDTDHGEPLFHVSFFGIRENRRSSKSAETFQKDASGDTDHGEPLYGQTY